MTFQREIGRVTQALLCGFFIVAAAAAYWAVTGPDGLLQRGDNPRQVLANQAIARGALLHSEGGILAESRRSTGAFERIYGANASAQILGRVEGGFGVSGVEAIFDALLRGEPTDPMAQAVRDLLHEPRAGADVMLTLSPTVQDALLAALGDNAGSALVIAIPGGKILGMVSQSAPVNAEATPGPDESPSPATGFSALQGSYPAGGVLLPGLLSAALLENLDITRADFPPGSCAVRLPADQLISLQEAFLYGCTGPFESVA
ncbi:MAG TPA: hypothetical protein VER79_09505, partial [Candidatus Limnocylindrales bacterium]|nr:hypothetical protein [Candidatus Limnocylindrales bacterium]